MVDPDIEAIRAIIGEILVAVGITLIMFVSFGWLVVRTGRLPHPASLVTALAMLTFVALIGYITTGREPLIAIASAGIGAIAGAVSSTFEHKGKDGEI